jgi:hypothetical protein
MAREYTNRVYLPDGDTVYVTDEAEGNDRFVELYTGYGDLKVEICKSEWGKSLSDCEVLVNTTLIELLEDEMDDLNEHLKLKETLNDTDKHIIHGLGAWWMPSATYKELEDEIFKRPELKKAIAQLRKLDLIQYRPGEGFNLTRGGELIQIALSK